MLPRPREALFLVLCAAILVRQLFMPGFIGMANNGDFPKVAGPLCLAGADRETEKVIYFQADYLRGPAYCYNPHIPSSEIVPASIASSLERMFSDKTHFDIRWLGAVHALLFAGFFYLMLVMLRPLDRVAAVVLSVVALWIFCDVSLVAYLNSFYGDVAAMLGGLTAVMTAVPLAGGKNVRAAPLFLSGLAALAFVTSKGSHALLVVLPLMAFVWLARVLLTGIYGCSRRFSALRWSLALHGPCWPRRHGIRRSRVTT